MVSAILVNAVFMLVEERHRNSANDDDLIWVLSDLVFTSIFTIEAVMKLVDRRCMYFLDGWNCFDFCLVLSGIIGLFFELLALGFSDYSNEGRLVRIARVFRVLRLVRLVRLWRLLLELIA